MKVNESGSDRSLRIRTEVVGESCVERSFANAGEVLAEHAAAASSTD